MSEQRVVLQLGQGVDAQDGDASQAARRAVQDALSGAALPFLDEGASTPHVLVTIGVPDPQHVDKDLIAQEVPFGRVSVNIVTGGLDIDIEGTRAVLAAASIELFCASDA